MKKLMTLALALYLAGVPFAVAAFQAPDVIPTGEAQAPGQPAVADGVNNGTILSFDNMAAISEGFLGTELIREGVPGAGAPWNIASAKGVLDKDSNLRIDVRGLVLADSGLNPVASFRGLLSCVSGDGTIQNVSTADFPADTDGNASIQERLILAGPCFAPVIFVTGPEGQWFAVTGSASVAVAPDAPVLPDLPDVADIPDEPAAPEVP